jgi:hypothetical protein
MRDPIYPGERMTLTGTVTAAEPDAAGCGWATVAIEVRADRRLCTTATVRIAVPTSPDDNPWRRSGDRWLP